VPRAERDPYAAPHAPRSVSGPLLRYAIIAGLLAAAGAGYATLNEGPGLTDRVPAVQVAEPEPEPAATLADASQDPAYQAAQAAPPQAAPTPPAPPRRAAARTPPRQAPPAAAESTPPAAAEPEPPPLATAPAATPLPPEG